MSIFKELETFFTRTVPNIVTKEIPDFVTEDIPSLFERETYAPEIPKLRKELERKQKAVQASRDAMYSEQGKLTAARARFLSLTEDLVKAGKKPDVMAPKELRLSEKFTDSDATLKDIEQAARIVTTVATFGLAEFVFFGLDNKNEIEDLNKQIAILNGTIGRFSRATQAAKQRRAFFEAEIAVFAKTLEEAGIEPNASAASQMSELEGEVEARRSMAANLLGRNMPAESIMSLTGLPLEDILKITPATFPDDTDMNWEAIHPNERDLLTKLKEET